MNRSGIVTVKVILWFIFGFVIFAAVFVAFYGYLSSLFYGECMANAFAAATELRAGFHELEPKSVQSHLDPMTVTLGDCVASMAFLNHNHLQEHSIEIEGILECQSGYRGYIIIGPDMGENEYGWEFWEWWGVSENKIRQWFIDRANLPYPACNALMSAEYSFEEHESDGAEEPIVLDGPMESGGTKSYCVTLWKTGSQLYDVTYEDGKCI